MSEDDSSGWATPGGWQSPGRPDAGPTPREPTPRPEDARPAPTGTPASFSPPPGAYAPAPGGYAPPPGGYAPPPGAWAPPPRPGLVPLRPLTLGDILGASFRVFRRNPRTTFGTALLAQAAVFVITLLVTGGAATAAFVHVNNALPQDRSSLVPGAVATVLGSLLVPVFLSVAVSAVLQGLFVLETSHQVVGEKLRLGGLLRQARGRIWALIGWVLMLMAAVLVFVAVLAGVITLLVIGAGDVGIGFGVLIGLVGGAGLAVLAVWIGTKTSMVPSILMLERLRLRSAIARSWRLTRFSFWRVFGTFLLVSVIVQAASSVSAAPIQFVSPIITSLLQPTGSDDATGAIVAVAVVYLLSTILSLVIGAIGSIIQAATIALLYIDLRIRREGLDLELVRHVERRAEGVTALPNPYRNPDPSAEGIPAR